MCQLTEMSHVLSYVSYNVNPKSFMASYPYGQRIVDHYKTSDEIKGKIDLDSRSI